MTLFPHLPHTQGIIEISLKPPKKPIYYTKKREFPHKEHKTNPPYNKKETPRLSPRVSFLRN